VLAAVRKYEPATIDEIGRAIGDPSWAMEDDAVMRSLGDVLRAMVDRGEIRVVHIPGDRSKSKTHFYAMPKNSS